MIAEVLVCCCICVCFGACVCARECYDIVSAIQGGWVFHHADRVPFQRVR